MEIYVLLVANLQLNKTWMTQVNPVVNRGSLKNRYRLTEWDNLA